MKRINRYKNLCGRERPFRVEARMAAPVAINDYLCLDSLLAYAVVREEMGADYWDQGVVGVAPECLMRPPLPLKRAVVRGQSGNPAPIWHASAALVPEGAHDVLWLKKQWESRPSLEKFAAYSGRGKIDRKAGPYKSWSVPVTTISVPRISWNACGDLREALRLLKNLVPALGKKRDGGLGLVREWSVQETERDESLVDAAGVVQRPIPVQADRASDWTMTDIRCYHPPYWLRQDARLCIAVGARRVDGEAPFFGRRGVAK